MVTDIRCRRIQQDLTDGEFNTSIDGVRDLTCEVFLLEKLREIHDLLPGKVRNWQHDQ